MMRAPVLQLWRRGGAAALSTIPVMPKIYPLDYPWRSVDVKLLEEETGVRVVQLPLDEAAFTEPLQKIRDQGGWIAMDEVAFGIEGTPPEKIEALIGEGGQFSQEHCHPEDEVRFITEGAVLWDVRGKQDQWLRLTAVAGDLVVIPKGVWHRFFLTAEPGWCRAKRIYRDTEGWRAIYRGESEVTGEAIDMAQKKTY